MSAFATFRLLNGDRDLDIAAMVDLMANYWPTEDHSDRIHRATVEIDSAYEEVCRAPSISEARAVEYALQAVWERNYSPHIRNMLDDARRNVLAAYAKERLSK